MFPISSSPYNRVLSEDTAEHGSYGEVQTVTLSSLILSNNIRHVDLLKLDCEGSEFDIIPSTSQRELAKVSQIRMECHGPPNGLIEDLRRKGYVVDRMRSDVIWLEKHPADPYYASMHIGR
jgi:hypothetical protein